MRSKLLSTAVGAAALTAAVLVSQVPGVAQAAPLAPLAPPAGSAVPTNAGNSDTLFGLTLPAGANCPSDTGYRAHTFIAPIGVDVAALTWSSSGSPVGSAQARNLYSNGGAAARNIFVASAPVVAGIQNIPGNLQLSAGGAFGAATSTLYAPGVYQVGVACGFVDPADNIQKTEKFYASKITITANTTTGGAAQVNFAVGTAPNAPVLTGGAVTVTTASLSFTQPNSAPASTYTVQVTPALPAGGTATISGVVVGASSTTGTVSLADAATNQAYDVTVTAANGITPNAVSNIVVVTPVATAQPAITPTFTPGVGSGTVTIPAVVVGTPAARTALPSGYTLTVTPTPTVAGNASFTIPFVAGPITQVVNGLTAGTVYTFTLVPTYAFPNGGPTTTATGTSNNAQVVQQRITVTRPVGQLILTQRCDVNGPMPALPADPGFPGFPSGLPAVAENGNQVGNSPDISPNGVFPTGAGLLANAINNDPQFGNYPFPSPASYPTECGVNLGTATIVNSGPLAGQYFQADGFINEVTISDARDTDNGWEVRGQMSDFVGTVSNSNVIDGDYLGWTPYVQNTTPTTGTGYTQTVARGLQVLPGTGVVSGSGGLGSGRRLSIATENLGLGIAQMDARLRMLIPTTANNDVYTGILNFTVLDNDNGTAP